MTSEKSADVTVSASRSLSASWEITGTMPRISLAAGMNSRSVSLRSYRKRIKARIRWAQSPRLESRFGDRAGHQLQIVRIGGIAPQAKRLAAPRRRPLPRHSILQGGEVGNAVARRDFERHLDEPAIDRCKRQLFGIDDARRAALQLT